MGLIGGTWVLQQTLTAASVTAAVVVNACATPGARGFSQRVAVSGVYPSYPSFTSTLIDSGKTVANNAGISHCPRFMTGQWMPRKYFTDGNATVTQTFFTSVVGNVVGPLSGSFNSFTLATSATGTIPSGASVTCPTVSPTGSATITLSATLYTGDTTVQCSGTTIVGTINNNAGVTGAPLIPKPWDDSDPTGYNTAFEGYFTQLVTDAAAWCRANADPILHLSWYSGPFAELFFSSDLRVTGAPVNYTYTKFLTGHQRLVDIAAAVAGPDLYVEFPLSGTGPLTSTTDGAGTHTLCADLAAYIASQPTAATQFLVQLNGWDYGTFYNAPNNQPYTILAGQTAATGFATEQTQEQQAFTPQILHGFQARNNADQDWQNCYNAGSPASGGVAATSYWNAQYVEVYASAFAVGQTHRADLLSNVLSFQPSPPFVASTPAMTQAVNGPRTAGLGSLLTTAVNGPRTTEVGTPMTVAVNGPKVA